jgi:hypothetical protein
MRPHRSRVPHLLPLALLLAVAASGCDGVGLDALTGHPSAEALPAAKHSGAHNFVAPLSGAQEVPAVATRARGNATFHLSADGTQLHYKLIVANIRNVTAAHIHLAPAGVNGPVVVFLYGPNPAGITTNGILSEGTITEANLVPSFDGTMEDLVALLRAGNAYVNVHTQAYPPGEIRGQIRPAGPRS